MKRIILTAIPFALTGCADIHVGFGHGFGGNETKGNGKPQEVLREVGEFDRVEVSSAFHVEASEGKLRPVKVTADSNLLTQIKTEVKDRTLKVWIDGSISTSSPLKLVLSTPKVNSFGASGATQVVLNLASGRDMNPISSQSLDPIKRHDLDLTISGASIIELHGTPSNLFCDLSGASKLMIPTKKTTTSLKEFGILKANLSGASQISYDGWIQTLNADLSGASSIKGKMKGHDATIKLTGASDISVGNFEKVSKELSGTSSAHFEESN